MPTRNECHARKDAPSGRSFALDAFRGLTIAAMILVNNPGDWGQIYAPLRHAAWDGWTPTDLVFPFFLFIAGVSMAVSFDRQAAQPRGRRLGKLARRSLLLIAIGLFLNFFLRWDFDRLRFPGVLQRIGACVLFVGALEILLPRWASTAIHFLGLGLYVHLALHFEVPGAPAGTLTPEGCVHGYVDRRIFGAAHLYAGGPYDPEGLVSTLTAAWNVWLGFLLGRAARHLATPARRAALLVPAGVGLAALGLATTPWMPINKPLWTPSYAVFTAGLASLFLALFEVVVPAVVVRRATLPFAMLGRNALLAFVLSGLLARTLARVKLTDETRTISLARWIYENGFLAFTQGKNASLAYALAHVVLFTLLAWFLDRRRIYVKL